MILVQYTSQTGVWQTAVCEKYDADLLGVKIEAFYGALCRGVASPLPYMGQSRIGEFLLS